MEYANGDQLVLFRDGTKFKQYSLASKIEIANEWGVVIRKMVARSKDFNVIGSGSAFAFLGEKDIL